MGSGSRTRCHPLPRLDCGFTFATVQQDLAFASLRLRSSCGLVCLLTPVWGWTHGMRPGVPLWAGSLRLRAGFGFLPSFCCLFSFPFALLGGGTRNCTKRSTTCSRPERPMVMRVRLIPYGRRGLLSVPCSLGCMTPRTPRSAVCTGPWAETVSEMACSSLLAVHRGWT